MYHFGESVSYFTTYEIFPLISGSLMGNPLHFNYTKYKKIENEETSKI